MGLRHARPRGCAMPISCAASPLAMGAGLPRSQASTPCSIAPARSGTMPNLHPSPATTCVAAERTSTGPCFRCASTAARAFSTPSLLDRLSTGLKPPARGAAGPPTGRRCSRAANDGQAGGWAATRWRWARGDLAAPSAQCVRDSGAGLPSRSAADTRRRRAGARVFAQAPATPAGAISSPGQPR